MRILQIIETGGPGGAETVFANLATGLRDKGHHVHCMVGDGTWLPAELRSRGLTPEILVSQRAVDFSLLQSIRAAIRRERIDVVHAHLFDGAVYASLAARCEGRRCVTTLHGQVDVTRNGWRGWLKRQLLRRNSDVIIAVSDALRSDVSTILNLPASKARVVYNGVQLPGVDFDLEPDFISTNRGESRRIVAVGNIRRPKNYPLLLEAFSRVRRVLPNATLHIVGQEDQDGLYESLVARTERHDLAGTVVFHGFLSDPRRVLLEADAFVLASTQEGFSLATLEAMLARVPVVATRCGGPEEIIRHGETGLLVPVDDSGALSTSLLRVLGDRELALQLTEAAYRDASSRFSVESMVESYLHVYRE
jgi:glycosyltransferase involved in cell wall biosynthesis